MLAAPWKSPEAELPYGLNWEDFLDGDEIADSEWEIVDPPDGSLVLATPSFSPTETVVWVSGGTWRKTYILRNTITTGGEKIATRDLRVYIEYT